ncbi:MAG: GIY-YIG nuclease family protein [Solirubrobacteraceae bacterium]
MSSLRKEDIPGAPGVYALYRSGKPMYVGKAKMLQDRVWKNHAGQGLGMGNSAMRRNVAEHLGIATASDIKKGLYRVSADEAKSVRSWLERCEIAWRECASETAAVELEAAMKKEQMPPLTKR